MCSNSEENGIKNDKKSAKKEMEISSKKYQNTSAYRAVGVTSAVLQEDLSTVYRQGFKGTVEI
jgi:hypothetical protein